MRESSLSITAPETGGVSQADAGHAAVEDRADVGKHLIKCVVWDLDNTLWEGTLLEGDDVRLRQKTLEIIRELDTRGILQSVASKNNHEAAMERLRQLGVADYFLYPQINWNSKAASIKQIVASLNINFDAVAFIDDQPFERAEVGSSLPQVQCFDVPDLEGLLDLPQLKPRFVTEDSKMRRLMYQTDIERNRAEEQFVGPTEEFLASLQMVVTLTAANEEDLARAEELTVRTNQLNTTGRAYSYEKLDHYRRSDRYQLLIAGLRDKFGSYGKIGLALVECDERVWTIRLLLMSCRVVSRGVGTILLSYIAQKVQNAGAVLHADFIPNERNRIMYVTYKFAGFRELGRENGVILLENDLSQIQAFPDYVKVEVSD